MIAIRKALPILFLSFFLVSDGAAQPGVQDLGFGSNGRASFISDEAAAIVVQPDGKIVVGGSYRGDFIIARFDANGQTDDSFGVNGRAITNFGGDDFISEILLQPDGRIVAVGNSSSEIAMARYNANGSLDNTFAEGGKFNMGTGRGSLTFDDGFAMALQSDGKIVVAYSVDSDEDADVVMFRLTSSGYQESAFGDGGTVTRDWGGDDDDVNHILIQEDGKILLAGRTGQGFMIARYLSDGSPDISFGSNGARKHLTGDAAIRRIALQPDGRIVAVGLWQYHLTLTRYMPDGSSDFSFNGNGRVQTEFEGNDSEGTALAIQEDGKIVVAATVGTTWISGFEVDFALVRYNADGSLDQSFGTAGVVLTDIREADYPTGIALQTDGKILLCGSYGQGGTSDGIILRYHGDNTTALYSNESSESFTTISPIPVVDEFVLQFSVESDRAIVSATLYDVRGTNAFSLLRAQERGSGTHRERFQIPQDLPGGVYVVGVDIGGRRERIKLLIE